MRTARVARRKRESTRLRARAGVDLAGVATDRPVCTSCGAPLVRLPRFLTSARGAGRGFQCQRCFYANTGSAPGRGETIASDRTRWLTEVLSEPGGARPRPSREAED